MIVSNVKHTDLPEPVGCIIIAAKLLNFNVEKSLHRVSANLSILDLPIMLLLECTVVLPECTVQGGKGMLSTGAWVTKLEVLLVSE